jgi:hypothetical protein
MLVSGCDEDGCPLICSRKTVLIMGRERAMKRKSIKAVKRQKPVNVAWRLLRCRRCKSWSLYSSKRPRRRQPNTMVDVVQVGVGRRSEGAAPKKKKKRCRAQNICMLCLYLNSWRLGNSRRESPWCASGLCQISKPCAPQLEGGSATDLVCVSLSQSRN